MVMTVMSLEALEARIRSALEDLKAVDPVVLDVRGKTTITDLMVIASGTSTRHVKSIADSVVEKAKQAGVCVLGIEGEQVAEWILVDLGDAVVHVMLPKVRQQYRLEGIWGTGNDALEEVFSFSDTRRSR
jgi:ribosome-associated protein